MSSLISSSIGKKLFMSITGFFLMSFLVVHLSINLMLIVDDSGELFNLGANFMATNPIIKVVEPVLAIGFLLHIMYAIVLTLGNMKARPVNYKRVNQSKSSTWSSRNMFVLGALVLTFLALHIMNFYWKIKVTKDISPVMVDGVEMHDTYALVAGLFKTSSLYCILYIVSGILLGFHLAHGFWSAFQTIGWSGDIWRKRIVFVGKIYAIIIAAGFSIIPLYFMIKF